MINVAPPAQASWVLTLCVGAWAAVEVPRYAFYLFAAAGAAPPPALTYLRYSLFLVLYPAGIAGEVGCLLGALAHARTAAPGAAASAHVATLLIALVLLYPPGSFIMVRHMWCEREAKLGKCGVRGARPKARAEKAA